MSRSFTVEEKARRWYHLREIQNLAGKFVTSILLKRETRIFDDFWADSDDVCLGFNEGYYVGPEAVKAYYAAEDAATCVRSALIRDMFPDKLSELSPEKLYGVGQLHAMPLTTPVLELAEDGQTAKGIWHVLGSDNTVTREGPLSHWSVGFLCIDFLYQNGAWKIWHVLLAEDLRCAMGDNWACPQNHPEDAVCAAALDAVAYPPYTVARDVYCAYSPARPFTAPPRIPEPYASFKDTFSYGV